MANEPDIAELYETLRECTEMVSDGASDGLTKFWHDETAKLTGEACQSAATALEAQSAQIAELQAEVERRASEEAAWRKSAIDQQSLRQRREAALLARADTAEAQIADLKRALDTARHDAMEEAAKAASGFAPLNGYTLLGLRKALAHTIRALKTKDQSHGA